MAKKIYIILGLLVFVLLLATLRQFQSAKTANTAKPVPTAYKIQYPSVFPSAATLVPTQGKMNISGVLVNDFYASKGKTDYKADILITDSAGYQISYSPKFNHFKITIISPDFINARKQAEQEFLRIAGISPTEACKLNADEGTSYKTNPDFAYQKLGLSFCPGR